MWTIMTFILIGLVAGWLASILVRGEKRPDDWGLLFGVGIGGSLLGGIVINLLLGNGLRLAFSGIIASAAFASLLLLLIGGVRARSKRPAKAGGKRN